MMPKLGLAVAIVLLGGSAVAQQPGAPTKPTPTGDAWAFVRLADGALAWNLESGRWFENNDRVEGNRLVYYAKPQEIEGKKVVWSQETWTIRCRANTYQVRNGEELTGELGVAFTLSAGEPFPIRENSLEHILKRHYCENVEFTSMGRVNGFFEVMDAMKAQ